MAKKKDANGTLPKTMGQDNMEPSSTITYASDVIAIIAGLAASEVEGIAGMVNVNGSGLGKNRNITRGIKVEVGTEEVSVDLYLNVEYGTPIQRAARDAQEAVKKNIESMTGMHVVRVDVHVLGVSFEKENNALEAGAGKAMLESGKDNIQPAKKDADDHKKKKHASVEVDRTSADASESIHESADQPADAAESQPMEGACAPEEKDDQRSE